MFCVQCGSQVEPNTTFCPNCGRPQQPGQAQQPPGQTPPPAAGPAPYSIPAEVKAQTGKWIGEGWDLVKPDIWMFLLIGLLYAVVSGAVPIILQGPMMAGMHFVFIRKMTQRRLELGDLFLGFNFFVPTLVANILISIFTTIGVILCIIPGLVIAAMYMFTYLFIIDKRLEFWPAMQASHDIVRKDYFGFTIFLVAAALLNVLGVLCCIIGVFVTLPIMYGAITAAYRDIVGFEPQTANRP